MSIFAVPDFDVSREEIWRRCEQMDNNYAAAIDLLRQNKRIGQSIPRTSEMVISRDEVGDIIDNLISSIRVANELTT